MRPTRLTCRWAAVVVAVCLVLAACGGSASPGAASPAPASVQVSSQAREAQSAASAGLAEEAHRILAAAKAKGENSLTLSWSGNSMGGSDGLKRFEAVFNKMYGTNVKIDFTPGPSMTDMAGKVAQEVAAGRPTSTDVLIGTDTHLRDLVDRDVLEDYDYTKLSPRIAKDMVANKNMGTAIYGTVAGVIYNTNLVPPADAPKKLEDVLNPRWKGKIASNADAAYLDIIGLRPEWGPDKMKDFVTKLSSQVGGLLRVGEEGRILSGEFSMLVMGNTHSVVELKGKDAPIGASIPQDAGIIRFVYLGVPRTAAHSNLGKLFINMVLSEEGQKTLYDVYFSDLPELPGSRAAADMRAQGVDPEKFLRVNVQFTIQHPEAKALNDDLTRILREGRSK